MEPDFRVHEDLKIADTVIVDDFYRADLGVRAPGEQVEINNRRARVVGLTQGIRSFTTTPFVFTSFKNALNYTATSRRSNDVRTGACGIPASLLPRSRPVCGSVSESGCVHPRGVQRATRHYWLFTTGAGIALLVAA